MPTAPLRRLVLILVPLVSGCLSAGGGGPTRVELEFYGERAQRFELVSESYTDRVAYYSTERTDAARKFQADEVMDALLEELDREGLERYLEPGPAPSQGHGVVTRAFEVERRGTTRHWAVGKGTEIGERQAFIACTQTFLQLYSQTAGFQTIHNEQGPAFFEKARTPRRIR